MQDDYDRSTEFDGLMPPPSGWEGEASMDTSQAGRIHYAADPNETPRQPSIPLSSQDSLDSVPRTDWAHCTSAMETLQGPAHSIEFPEQNNGAESMSLSDILQDASSSHAPDLQELLTEMGRSDIPSINTDMMYDNYELESMEQALGLSSNILSPSPPPSQHLRSSAASLSNG
ncbi:hypothetical protein CALVIDRAFT_568956 [Calocera viscosa TUFC12733]|uniref:Uncharacterized protein n=1 Tax=Calocera viscosa (strain TUFC12733) TaxID=1330018 RepID=A0A167GGM1_CALVF|nr:hypothetical protein CALVIDRAFT_568956 [Calocera viscosa TUFC12733]